MNHKKYERKSFVMEAVTLAEVSQKEDEINLSNYQWTLNTLIFPRKIPAVGELLINHPHLLYDAMIYYEVDADAFNKSTMTFDKTGKIVNDAQENK